MRHCACVLRKHRSYRIQAALQRRLDGIHRDDRTILQLTHQDVAQHPVGIVL